MKPFLSEYIFSTASRTQRKIQDVLSAAYVSKTDLDTIAERIDNISERSPILVGKESYGGLISNVTLDSVNRDVGIRMRELYDEANLVSLLLDSHSEILSSDIKKQSDQIDAFDKYLSSYAFLLADSNFYDHAYTESFSDDLQQEKGPLLDLMLYDRSGIAFDKQLGNLEVDQGSGLLTLSSSFITEYPMEASVVASNCQAFIESDTGIAKATSSVPGEGWRTKVTSPRPIVSSLAENTDKGAQFEVEFLLTTPSPCDTFSIAPMADLPLDILSIKLYKDGASEGLELIDAPSKLDKNKLFYFAPDVYSKVVMVVNQPVYKRGSTPPRVAEINYKEAREAEQLIQTKNKRQEKYSKAFDWFVRKWFIPAARHRSMVRRPLPNLEKYTPVEISKKELLQYQEQERYVYSLFDFGDKKRNIFRQWLIEKLFHHQTELVDRFVSDKNGQANQNRSIPPVIMQESKDRFFGSQDYEYVLGLRAVRLGVSLNKNSGLFISKAIPAPIQSGVTRIDVQDNNYLLVTGHLDDKRVTSIEYSVTNKSVPLDEKDWVPILPSKEYGAETYERLFVQSSGYAPLRFPAAAVDNGGNGLRVFKNGIQLRPGALEVVRSNDVLTVVGVRIPRSEFSLNLDDVYTAIYMPAGDPTTVDFKEKGFKQKSLASAGDENGVGEYFEALNNSYDISVTNHPYINFDKIEDETSYSREFGLVGTYQPIQVVLDDGTIAYNYTNYRGLSQNVLRNTDSKYAFVQSGKRLIFNKEIDQGFRVYYQYEPSHLKYRIIFRINRPERISPYVDSLSIKSKLNASILGMNEKKV